MTHKNVGTVTQGRISSGLATPSILR